MLFGTCGGKEKFYIFAQERRAVTSLSLSPERQGGWRRVVSARLLVAPPVLATPTGLTAHGRCTTCCVTRRTEVQATVNSPYLSRDDATKRDTFGRINKLPFFI